MKIAIEAEREVLIKAQDGREIRGGGMARPIEAGFIQRVVQGVRYAITGVGPGTWFGPGQPMLPTAPEEVKGRRWDYPVGYNLYITQRPYEGINFYQLRALADNYDILRLVIETRKDQIARMKWNLKHRPGIGSNGGGPNKPSSEAEAHIGQATDFLVYPDNEHNWDQWLRILIEDMLVIDGSTIFPRKTKGGQPYALEVFDGATILPKIGADGRRPDPPDVAYQQILKGLPAVDFTKDELIYFPRNPRSWKVFGYSPVEQIVRTVNIGLRRMLFQLAYYTEGNVPEALIGVPKEWTTDQIKQFQEYWDDLMEGNLAQRRHARFVPGDMKFQTTKEAPLKDEFDEWLARVVCFAFSISPQPFVKEMNRATAATAQEMSQKEGLAPLLRWVKNLIDLILWKYWNFRDIEFEWEEEEEVGPLEQAQVDQIYSMAGIKTKDEIRGRMGLDPLPEEPEPVSLTLGPDGLPIKPPVVEKRKKKLSGIDRQRKIVLEARGKFKKLIAGALQKARKETRKLTMPEIQKADVYIDAELKRILSELKFRGFAMVMDGASGILEAITKDGVYQALLQVGLSEENFTGQMNEKALKYAKDRAAELVGKRRLPDGTIIDNPNRKWAIEDSTRDMLRGDVSKAIEEGWSTKQLQDQLWENYAFSDERAEMIARTEIAFADSRGNQIAYKESGLVSGKEWILAPNHADEDECDDAAAAGIVPIDQPFPGVDVGEPPAHPHCLCDCLPVLEGEEEG